MKFFNLDSPLMKFLTKMTDVLWINILTLILCIPIVTAGAAFTAMHYVCLKMVRDEDGYITKEYFKSFKQNFKQATIIWVGAVLVILFIVFDLWCLQSMENPTIIFASLCAVSIFLFCTLLYVFPVLSHFENTIKGTVKNSFFMSILALPRTILMIVLNLLPITLIYLVERFETMFWIMPLCFLFWFSAPAYFCAKLYDKTFKKFEPEDAKKENDDFTWTVGGTEEEPENTDGVEKTEE